MHIFHRSPFTHQTTFNFARVDVSTFFPPASVPATFLAHRGRFFPKSARVARFALSLARCMNIHIRVPRRGRISFSRVRDRVREADEEFDFFVVPLSHSFCTPRLFVDPRAASGTRAIGIGGSAKAALKKGKPMKIHSRSPRPCASFAPTLSLSLSMPALFLVFLRSTALRLHFHLG